MAIIAPLALIAVCLWVLHLIAYTISFFLKIIHLNHYAFYVDEAISVFDLKTSFFVAVFFGLIYYGYFCVHSIYNTAHPPLPRELLKDQGSAPSLPYAPSLDVMSKENTSVVLVIHGAWDNPAFMRSITDFIKANYKQYDVATSLLHKHGGNLKDLADFSYNQALLNIKSDINFLTTKYKKVICIAHSLAGCILTELATSEIHNFDEPSKLSIVLYEPSLVLPQLTLTQNFLLYIFGTVLGYCIFAEVGGYEKDDPICYTYAQFPMTKELVDACHFHSKRVYNTLDKLHFRHKFGYIINDKSDSIIAQKVVEALDKSDKKVAGVHIPFKNTNPHRLHVGSSKEMVDEFLGKLKEVFDAVAAAS